MRETPAVLLDIALRYDATHRRCDLVMEGGRLALDRTPLTPMLVSLGSDRRALPDDDLPDTVTDASLQTAYNPRRGWAGDFATTDGSRIGSRLWLLERAKLSVDTLRDAETYAEEALTGLSDREGIDIGVSASVAGRDIMLLDVRCGSVRQQLRVKVGG